MKLLLSPHATGRYRSDIDGLRAFAVLSVVLYHAFPKVVTGGFVGVDIRAGPGCLNRFSASISGASAEVRLPSGEAAW
jgi:hypothetical protein